MAAVLVGRGFCPGVNPRFNLASIPRFPQRSEGEKGWQIIMVTGWVSVRGYLSRIKLEPGSVEDEISPGGYPVVEVVGGDVAQMS